MRRVFFAVAALISSGCVDAVPRQIIALAILLLSAALPAVGEAQETGTSFWFRLAADASIEQDVVAIIDFFPDKEPLVRVNSGAATGREIEDVKRTLISVRRTHQGQFPVGRRLVISRSSQSASPDTNRADSGGRRELTRLREIERRAKFERGLAPFLMTLIVDKHADSR